MAQAKKWGNALSILGETLMMTDPRYAQAGYLQQQGRLARADELEKEKKKEEQQRALARIAEDLVGRGVVPQAAGVMGPQQPQAPISTESALARMAGVTGDPSALLNYQIQQNDPLRKLQLRKAEMDIANAQRVEPKTYTIGNTVYRDANPYDDVPPQPFLTGPAEPYTPQSALGKLAADYQAGYVPEQTYLQEAGLAQKTTDMKDVTIPDFDIAPGAYPTKDDAKVVKDVTQAKRQLDTLMTEYGNMVQKYGYEPEGSNDAKDLRQKEAQIQLQMKTLEDLGALQAPDIEILARMMGSPVMTREGLDNFIPLPLAAIHPYKAFTSRSRSTKRVNDFKDYLDGRIDSVLKTRGYVPKEGSQFSDDPLGLFK